MSNAILTSNGRVTIPKDIRDSLGMKPGDRLAFTLMPDGTVVMRVQQAPTMRRRRNRIVRVKRTRWMRFAALTGILRADF